jgi:hypothetical protein
MFIDSDLIIQPVSHLLVVWTAIVPPSSVSFAATFSREQEKDKKSRTKRVKSLNSLLLMLGEGSGMRVDSTIAFCV